MWSVWLDWLLDYFLRSETNFDIYQNIYNRIITYVWVSKNYSSDILIPGESHFSIFEFYTYSPKHIWWFICYWLRVYLNGNRFYHGRLVMVKLRSICCCFLHHRTHRGRSIPWKHLIQAHDGLPCPLQVMCFLCDKGFQLPYHCLHPITHILLQNLYEYPTCHQYFPLTWVEWELEVKCLCPTRAMHSLIDMAIKVDITYM